MTAPTVFLSEHTTPLGNIRLLADELAIYWLAFSDSEKSDLAEQRYIKKQGMIIKRGETSASTRLIHELNDYASRQRSAFSVTLKPQGTAFQQSVWQALQAIPYGRTCSYAALAKAIGRPTAVRAVAQANAANPLCIVIPCHRVINHSGQLGGYSGGLHHKKTLLALEEALL